MFCLSMNSVLWNLVWKVKLPAVCFCLKVLRCVQCRWHTCMFPFPLPTHTLYSLVVWQAFSFPIKGPNSEPDLVFVPGDCSPMKTNQIHSGVGCGLAPILLYGHVCLYSLMPFLVDQWGSLHLVVVAVYFSLPAWTGELSHPGFRYWVWLLFLPVLGEPPYRRRFWITTGQLCPQPGTLNPVTGFLLFHVSRDA